MSDRDQTKVLRSFFQQAMSEPEESGRELIDELTQLQEEGKFSLGEKLSEGGMKDILLKEDRMTQRPIVMALPKEEKRDMESLTAFVREARITAQVAHPSVLPIHEIGVNEDGVPFYTMKYIRGDDFSMILRKLKKGDLDTRQKYPLNRLLAVFTRICEAIAFAHSKGIVHLDLKPDNILINPYGVVQVCDWGLAQYLDKPTEDMEGKLRGTPGYMAPEQISGNPPSEANDIFALGVILYQILTYELPFEGKTAEAMLKRTVLGQVTPIMEANLSFRHPAPLRAICRKAMKHEVTERYASVKDILKDLESFQNYRPTLAQKPGPVGLFMLLLKRHKTVSILSMVAITIIVCLSAIFNLQIKKEELQRIELAEKAIEHFNQQAKSAMENFDFEKAREKAEESLRHKDNFEANLILSQYYIIQGNMERASFYGDKCKDKTNRYTSIANVMAKEKGLEGDEFTLKLAQVVLQHHHPGLAVGICHRRNAMRKDLQSHLPFLRTLIERLSPQLKDYELSIKNNRISFRASEHFTRLAPFANLPIEELILNQSFVRDLSALRGSSSIKRLELNNTMVSRLEPLKGIKIDHLDISNTMVHDLRIFEDVQLKEIRMKGIKCLAMSVLAEKPELESVELDEKLFTTPHDKRHIATFKKRGIFKK